MLYPNIFTPQSALRCTITDYNYTTRRGHLLQYTIPTRMLRALAVLQCRAKEQIPILRPEAWGQPKLPRCSIIYQQHTGLDQSYRRFFTNILILRLGIWGQPKLPKFSNIYQDHMGWTQATRVFSHVYPDFEAWDLG